MFSGNVLRLMRRRHARRVAQDRQRTPSTPSASASAEPAELPSERPRRRFPNLRSSRSEMELNPSRLHQLAAGSSQGTSRLGTTASRIRSRVPVRIPHVPLRDALINIRASQRQALERVRLNTAHLENNISVIDLTSSDTEASSVASSILPPLGQTSSSSDSTSSDSSISSSESILSLPTIPDRSDSDSSINPMSLNEFSSDEE